MCIFQFPLTFYLHKTEQNCYRQTCFHASKYTKNAFATRALPRTCWGSLQRSPTHPSWILGSEAEGRGGRGKGEERRGGEGARFVPPPKTAGLDSPLGVPGEIIDRCCTFSNVRIFGIMWRPHRCAIFQMRSVLVMFYIDSADLIYFYTLLYG